MDRPPQAQAILTALRIRGPLTAPELCRALGFSQPTFSRAVRTEPAILVVGRARETRYAARRDIAAVETPLPLYEIGAGGSSLLATLHPIHPRGFWVESSAPIAGFYEDLPWFLNDLRPTGFLGRRAAAEVPQLGLPADVRYWSGDQVLAWLWHAGVSGVGSLVLGDPSLVRALTGAPEPAVLGTPADYADLADRAMSEGIPGSSAAGEQPKFLAIRQGVPVLVKFSPRVVDAPSARVGDLLRAEHAALEIVAEHGVSAARSRLIEDDERVYLELERFDRVPAGGCAGQVSLLSLDSAFVGDLTSWSSSVEALVRDRRVAANSLPTVRWLDQFGAFIANTDRHAGNLSFRLDGGRVGALAPVYDMLPMHYFPRNNTVIDTPFPLPAPAPSFAAIQRSAHAAALTFWERVAGEVSAEFAGIARECHARVGEMGALLARLPG